MGTIKQKRLAREIKKALESKENITGGELAENSGYAPSLKKYPGRVIDTPGTREELQKIGIDVEEVDSVVKSILKGGKKDENKLKAADLLYKRTGSYANEKKVADAFESLLNLHSEIEKDEQSERVDEDLEEESDSVYSGDVEIEPSTD